MQVYDVQQKSKSAFFFFFLHVYQFSSSFLHKMKKKTLNQHNIKKMNA